ncbi:hypothetical protein SEA_EFRA2_92 [Mycobacterium phage Efra2]|nr:hypothetical protein SEA_EFRA2_92 [Mycobacterium phage Efra2]
MTDIADRADAAAAGVTPGPWEVIEDYDQVVVAAGTRLSSPGCYTDTDEIMANDLADDPDEPGISDQQRWTDARFVAAARMLVPELADEVRRLQAQVASVEALAAEMEAQHGQCWNSISGSRIRRALEGVK